MHKYKSTFKLNSCAKPIGRKSTETSKLCVKRFHSKSLNDDSIFR